MYYRNNAIENDYLNRFNLGECLLINISNAECLYYDEENGYGAYNCTLNTIYGVNGKDISLYEIISIQGISPKLKRNSNYNIKGVIVEYRGRKQLKYEYAEEIMPTTAEGIYRFLCSGMIKHIKKATAHKLVYGYKTSTGEFEGFGDKTLDIIENKPELLVQIKGISITKASDIHESFMLKKAYANTVMFLSKFNISPNKIMRVYKIHGLNTLDIIQNKPYSLADSVRGFGFTTCDQIALSMDKFTIHDIERLKTGLIYCMEKAQADDGHCFLTKAELISNAILELSLALPIDDCKRYLDSSSSGSNIKVNLYNKEYEISYDTLKSRYDEVVIKRKYDKTAKVYIDIITPEEILTAMEYLIIDGTIIRKEQGDTARYYLEPTYQAEIDAAKALNSLLCSKVEHFNTNISELIDMYCEQNNITLEEMQKKAIEKMFENNVLVLTGNAGSGKTFTTKVLIKVFELVYKHFKKNFTVYLCSPTGKAAKRLSESTGMEATTIHRLLGWQGEELNSEAKLDCDLLIVDETSMVDIFLYRSLLRAVDPTKTKVLFIGDDKQLLPVGPGAPFVDMLENGHVPKVKLNVVKRQAENSGIIKNANRIINREMIATDKENKDFYVIFEEDKEKVANLMIASAQKLVSSHNYTVEDIQLLCPQKSGVIGTVAMNKRMQDVFNPKQPDKPELVRGSTTFRIGDKVIHTSRNRYNLPHYKIENERYVEMGENYKGVFNGDMGIIIDIIEMDDPKDDEVEESYGKKQKYVVVAYDKMIILYDREEIENLELAYALTIHKSQGSQFKAVITCLHYTNYLMLTNNLTYTDITRGEKFVCVIGQEKAISHAIRNVETFKRNTGLSELIKKTS